jgi:kynurenine formamidase
MSALQQTMAEQGVKVERGDILCLRTGFADLLMQMQGRPDVQRLESSCAVLDGADPALRRWIADSGIAALVADNYAVEGIPAESQGMRCRLPLHELCLFKLGIPLGELWLLGELAQALAQLGRTDFLLTAPPLRLPGAVGSPVTPIATL